MRWLLLLLLVMPAWGQSAELDELIAVGRAATDTLQGIAADSRALIRDGRRPDPFSYQPAVKSLTFRSLALKGKVPPELDEAASLAQAGTDELQRCLDQLSVLADHPEEQPERERLLATLTRAHDTLARLLVVLSRASRTPATPPAPTPPQ